MTPIIIFIILLLWIFFKIALKIIKPYEKGIIERFGKYNRIVDPGIAVVLPIVETILKVDLREQSIFVPAQQVISKDKITFTIDALISYQITDPYKVIYNVANLNLATVKLAQISLTNIVKDVEQNNVLNSQEIINNKLLNILNETTDRWGVNFCHVEVRKIDLPPDKINLKQYSPVIDTTSLQSMIGKAGKVTELNDPITGEKKVKVDFNDSFIFSNEYSVDKIIGRKGKVFEPIDPVSGQGLVKIESKVWFAFADEYINKGKSVVVTAVEGTKLRVQKV